MEKTITIEVIEKLCNSINVNIENLPYELAIGKPYVCMYDVLKEIGLKTNHYGEVIYA